jgi:competence protein ComEC
MASGLAFNLTIFVMGGLLVWKQDLRNDPNWIGHLDQKEQVVTAVLQEPLIEKEKSFKSVATVQSIQNGKISEANVILYFSKDSLPPGLDYGSRLVFRKTLQPIKNRGNPGGFNYERYCLFEGISFQVYLRLTDFTTIKKKEKSAFQSFIFNCRNWTLGTIKKYIPGKKEQGLAEALIIGYKFDLDKDLVQAYSNTGVIHVIAISGMHLGLIYWILLIITRPLKNIRSVSWLRLILIISGLWLFAITAGAQPSIVRSALMFSCLATGQAIAHKTSIYNTLSFSAFMLLCYNPFWLWDAGFQLSYAAVTSIVLFFKPVYNLFYFKNRLLDFTWQLLAVTLSAQLLTLPLSLYHFHQFPNFFLFTNIVAVPLSSLILIGGILLLFVQFFQFPAMLLGKGLAIMIGFLNSYIERFNNLHLAVSDKLFINFEQCLLLTITISGLCLWLMEKKKILLWTSLISLLIFSVFRTISFFEAVNRRELVVYNISKMSAMELVEGRNAVFLGPANALTNAFINDFHLKPLYTIYRTKHRNFFPHLKYFSFGEKEILVLDRTIPKKVKNKIVVDVLVLSGNPKLYMQELMNVITPSQIVLDASVPQWKAKFWRADLDKMKISYHDVTEKGAFVMNLQPLPLWPLVFQ